MTRDTWGGNANRPLSLNRWIYGLDNPSRYTDPSGLSPLAIFKKGNPNGIDATDAPEWTQLEKQAVNNAASTVATAYAKAYNREMRYRALGECESLFGWLWLPEKIGPNSAFNAIHGGPITFWRMSLTSKEYWKTDAVWYAMEVDERNIYVFKNFTEATLGNDLGRMTRLFVHEIGHAFDDAIYNSGSTLPSDSVGSQYVDHEGFFGVYESWMFHSSNTPIEFFADMFIGWVYQKWDTVDYIDEGNERRNFMDVHMSGWIVDAIGDTR